MRIILDTDPGVDDALAIMYLAAQEDAEIVAVGSVHGNVPSPLAAQNALRVLELLGIEAPVAIGAARPLAQPLQTAEFVHGADGLGGRAGAPPLGTPVSESAAEQLVRLARAQPGELTLLALGPLTNIALAVLLEPDLPKLLRSVVIMGGAVSVPGNITPYADANFFHDPEAADLVLGAGFGDITLVGLDATEQTRAGEEWLTAVSGLPGPRAEFATGLLDHYAGFYTQMFGTRGCTLHDPLAAAIMLDTKLATFRDMPLAVELTGTHTRGQVVSDQRVIASDAYIASGHSSGRLPVKVAETVDVPRFLEQMYQALT
ncbi:nucleoside hydrolase [Actinophytocola oryzae]|uniref:Purine nucleosidase n=1 Tax=Actinophytocola oryzae TaxID=502181 RepID=A0A4R7VIC0_9PSEU|nr:nucleoside hydrolase [Actinophytocola oryzae]TDV48927.1 purine nucleosidase [Actinophytocola oryzae]